MASTPPLVLSKAMKAQTVRRRCSKHGRPGSPTLEWGRNRRASKPGGACCGLNQLSLECARLNTWGNLPHSSNHGSSTQATPTAHDPPPRTLPAPPPPHCTNLRASPRRAPAYGAGASLTTHRSQRPFLLKNPLSRAGTRPPPRWSSPPASHSRRALT